MHIPKTGGQSIENFFLSLHGLDWESRSSLLLRFNENPKLGPERLAHLMASEYVRFGYTSQSEFDSYYKFAFVRNPFSRLVSEYKYRNHDKSMSFKKFVMENLPVKNSYTDAYRHIIPQYDYIHNNKGELLVDFVGKLETFQKDFDYVCSCLGLSDSRLPHVNSTSKNNNLSVKNKLKRLLMFKRSETQPYSDYYDKELKEVVAEMYKKDIEKFEYSFDSKD
ncbi:sulfotransferase family 2 domain-containing protein [Methylophaga thalassica]|nr:sulfotransferase family 2 domain-containing protein [Methylophaga thalassica]WVI86792.1 sulfotransferase family 2 domain-containing protein [Methylophaga thalassica]